MLMATSLKFQKTNTENFNQKNNKVMEKFIGIRTQVLLRNEEIREWVPLNDRSNLFDLSSCKNSFN